MNLFSYSNYRKVIADAIKQNKTRGYQASLARAAQCQGPYISQVLSGKAHLTQEQGLRLAQFWNYIPKETEYFLLLLNLNRAGSPELEQFYQTQMDGLRAEVEKLSKRFQEAAVADTAQSVYYSIWLGAAAHMLLTVPNHSQSAVLARRLNCTDAQINVVLKQLLDLGLVTRKGIHWSVTQKSIHLSSDSPLNVVNHLNWRNRAVIDASAPNGDSLHYTAVHSLSRHDIEKIRRLLLEVVDQTRSIVRPSMEEDVICLTVDFFRI
jgi:uncharacterized protein (TIGR02147 family)